MKLSNKEVNYYVNNLKSFETNSGSIFSDGGRDKGLYAVYSYGFHFPMYVYDTASKQWFGNHDKYSNTTSSHQSYAQPSAKIHWIGTREMKLLTAAGSLTVRCANRMKGEAA